MKIYRVGDIVKQIDGTNYTIIKKCVSKSGNKNIVYVINRINNSYIKIDDIHEALNLDNIIALLEDPDYNTNAIETLRIYDSLNEKKQRELVGRQFQSLKKQQEAKKKVTEELEAINKAYIINEKEVKIIEDNARFDLLIEEIKKYY